MGNKYYVPDISEFHIGFEYEFKNGDRWEQGMLSSIDCRRSVCGEDYYESFFEEIIIKIRDVRVKFLDKDDILSLGWKSDNGSIMSFVLQAKYPWSLMMYPRECDIENNDKGVWLRMNCWGQDKFMGYFKNKSELKLLMKQTGVYASSKDR